MPVLRKVQARWIERNRHALPFQTHDGHPVYLPPDITIYSGTDTTTYEVRGSDAALKTNRFEQITVVEYNHHAAS